MANWWEYESSGLTEEQKRFRADMAKWDQRLKAAEAAAPRAAPAPTGQVLGMLDSSRTPNRTTATKFIPPTVVPRTSTQTYNLPERYQAAGIGAVHEPPVPAAGGFWDWALQGTKERVQQAWERPKELQFAPPKERQSFLEAILEGQGELEGLTPGNKVLGALSKAPGILFRQAGQGLEMGLDALLGKSDLGVGVRQVGSAALQALQEPAKLLEEATGAAAIVGRPESQGLAVEEWAPLTESTWSLAWQQAQERLGLREPAEEGEYNRTAGWGRDVLGQALEDIKSGRKTADQIVNEEDMPVAEFIGQFAADPLNAIDVLNPSNLRRINRAVEASEAAYGIRLVETVQQAEKAGQAGRLEKVLGKASEIMEAVNPLALSAAARVDEDTSNLYLLVSGLVEGAENAKTAMARLGDWMQDPAKAADLYGEAFASERGVAAARLLRDLDTEHLVSLVPGRPFSGQMLARELTMDARDVLEEMHGLTDPTGYRKFARSFKGFGSEFYLTMNPGYWVRNATDNAATLSYDGILALDTPAHLEEYVGRLGAVSKRAAMEGAPPASKLPGPLGWMSNKTKEVMGRLPVGEEAFYRRGYVGAHRRTMSKLWHGGGNLPDLPEELAGIPWLAADVQAAARSGLNVDEIADAVQKVLNPKSPGESLAAVMRYLDADDLQALSPAMVEHIRQGVLNAGSWDEVEQLLDGAVEELLVHGDDAVRLTPIDVTARSVWTQQELEEVKANLITGLLEDARRAGLDDAAAVDRVSAAVKAMDDGEAAVASASSKVMQRAGQLRSSEGMQLALRANRRQEQLIEETRRIVDGARDKAWSEVAALRSAKKGPARQAAMDSVWNEYFATANREWSKNFRRRLEEFEAAYVDLEALGRGVPFEKITGLEARAFMVEQMEYATGRSRVAMGDLKEAADFDARLAILRARGDEARLRAWDAAAKAPDQRSLDILDSADRMGQTIARKWRAEREYLREMVLKREEKALAALEQAKEISKELRRETQVERFHIHLSYRRAQNKLAQERFRELGQVWEIAELEIRGAPAHSRVEKLLALDLKHTFNFSAEEAQRLAGLDLGLGALPEGELGRRTLQQVRAEADQIALELNAGGGLPLEDWAQVARNRHPTSLEDAAELWGIDVEAATAEDWGRLAEGLHAEQVTAAEMSTPQGLDAMAYRAAHIGKKRLVEVGGVTREARDRAMSATAQAEYRRRLLGPMVDQPKEFYRRQGDLAQWYFDLEEAARARAAGGARVGLTPPEWVARESLEALERSMQLESLAKVRDVGPLADLGGARHPRADELLAVTEPAQMKAIERIREGLRGDWTNWRERQTEQELVESALSWVRQDVAPRLRDAQIMAASAAEQVTNFALHNYSRTNKLDEFLSLIFPYHFWYTRAGANWARRLANNPSRMATYLRYKEMMADINEERGLRSRFEGKWRVAVPEGMRDALGLEWMAPAAYFDPVQFMFPYATFDRADYSDPEELNSWLERAYRSMRTYAPQPYAFLQVPLQLSEVGGLEEKESFRDIWPQTAPLRAATAMLGVGGPEGVDLEGWLRDAFGLPEQEQWQPYRVRRMLASMAADEPGTSLMALRAQELQDRVEAQELELAVAVGDREPAGDELFAIANEFEWTVEETEQAQDMLREAVKRSALELGIRRLSSYGAGMGLTVLAEGEEKQLRLQEEGGGLLWSAENPQGSMADYQAWKAQHPEVVVRQKQYRDLPDLVPGEEIQIAEREGLGPAEHANYLQQKAAKDKIHAKYDALVDQALRRDPKDWNARSALEAERRNEIAAAEEQWPLPENPREMLDLQSGELPEGWSGQNPAEFAEYVAEQVVYALQEDKPEAGAYENAAGEVDWDGYFAALDDWEAGLPEELPQIDAVRVLGGQYAGMSVPEIVETYGQRYDSPLEAVARVYRDLEDLVWDEYFARRDQEKGAYERIVAPVLGRAIAARELIPAVMDQYEGRWDKAMLEAVYQGVVFAPRETTGSGKSAGAGLTGGSSYGDGAATSGSSGTSLWSPEMGARVAAQGWREAYGAPSFEVYPRTRGGGRSRRQTASSTTWSPPGWQYRRRLFGGPQFGRG